MKRNKLMALAMTVSMIATSIVSAVSVNAEDVVADKGDITKGFDLVYNETKSDADTRAIDIYVNDYTAINGLNLVVQFTPVGVIQNDAGTNPMVDYAVASFLNEMQSPQIMKMPTMEVYMLNLGNNVTAKTWDGGYVGTLMLDVPDADSTFTATVMANANIKGDQTFTKDTLEVPAFVSEPVDTRSEFEATNADYVGTFDADTTTVPVAAWIAEIDYSAVKIADGASLVWKVDTATVDTVSGTTVSGEGSVFYGLAIAGRADQLSTIETVQLVAE